jgi:16S rRNA (uracil1498-N3)-methyltransferase
MRRRFFVDRFEHDRAILQGDAAHHAARVLRVAPGQLFELSDGHAVWLARVETARRDAVEFSLLEPISVLPSKLDTSLLLSIVKFDRFEWALEKATELGVTEVTPLAAARSEKALIVAAAKRAARWEKILSEAAQQSRCLRTPALHPVVRPAEAFRAAAAGAPVTGPADDSAALLLFFSEFSGAQPLRNILQNCGPVRRVTLAIGPEGGWIEEERAAALALHFAEAGLGPTILRTETAVAAALASINYALGGP